MTYKRMRRRAIARGVIDGVYESLTGKPFYKKPEAKGPEASAAAEPARIPFARSDG